MVLGWFVLSGRNLARLRWSGLRWPLFRDILRVGAVASLQSVQTNVTIAFATALVAAAAGVLLTAILAAIHRQLAGPSPEAIGATFD